LALAVLSDDPTDLSVEEYCQTCEGTTYVEGIKDGKFFATNCPDCKDHPGLSKIGAIRANEDMVN
jgi:hypothetical protein